MKYIAFFVKGLQPIVSRELHTTVPDIEVHDKTEKHIVFSTQQPAVQLTSFRTIDDVCIYLGELSNLPAGGLGLQLIGECILESDLSEPFSVIQELRSVRMGTFSITASAYKTQYSADTIVENVSSRIERKSGWKYIPREHTNVDFRIVVSGGHVFVGVRVAAISLHHRKYKTAYKKGSLRPTIAAAMVFAATGVNQNLQVVDNFCGSGTILCEAVLLGHTVAGGDIDSESAANARRNLKNAGVPYAPIKSLDATKKNWPYGHFDCAISNLPWGKQIKTDAMTTLYANAINEYKRILKPRGTLCLLGMKPNFLMSAMKKVFGYNHIQTFQLGYIGQNPTMIVARG